MLGVPQKVIVPVLQTCLLCSHVQQVLNLSDTRDAVNLSDTRDADMRFENFETRAEFVQVIFHLQ